jgi:hypothetical protein
MNNILFGIIDWIKSDYKTNKFRFCVELVAWGISIGCAITMALTVPTRALLALYPLVGCLKIRPKLMYRAAALVCRTSLLISIPFVFMNFVFSFNVFNYKIGYYEHFKKIFYNSQL